MVKNLAIAELVRVNVTIRNCGRLIALILRWFCLELRCQATDGKTQLLKKASCQWFISFLTNQSVNATPLQIAIAVIIQHDIYSIFLQKNS